MAYTRPAADAIEFSWQGSEFYTRPDADAIGFNWSHDGERVECALIATLPPLTLPPLTFSGTATLEKYVRPRADAIGFSWQGSEDYERPAADAIPFSWDEAPRLDGSLSATLPALSVPQLSASLAAAPVHNIAAAVSMPNLVITTTFTGELFQNLDLPDNEGPGARMPYRESDTNSAGVRACQAQGFRIDVPAALPSQFMSRIVRRLQACQTQMIPTRLDSNLPHHQAEPIQANARACHTETIRTFLESTACHQNSIRINSSAALKHAETIKRRTRRGIEHQHGTPTSNSHQHCYANAQRVQVRVRVCHQHGDKPAPGRWWPFYEPPGLLIGLPCVSNYIPRPLSCTVLLSTIGAPQPYCPALPDEGGTIIIPVLEVYIVANTFTLVRTDDNTPIEALSFNASIDRDSWSWSFSASIPAGYLDVIRPESAGAPVQVTATINGTPIHFLVEQIRRERRFAQVSLSISGRGRAAYLAAPYSPALDFYNDAQRTAQQLINDALMVNGVPIGWSLDWNITDWQVPIGAWSHTGSYIDAVIRVAEAGGAYVQAHDTADELIILPHYPLTPWNWASGTPDYNIPESIITVEGIEWTEKPSYNAVWIVGGADGRKDKIKRTGTAADRPAPTIVDPLATDIDMTRQRGTPILSDTGRQALISLSLPVLPETGIIRPGALVDYTENATTRRGLVRGVNINHTFPSLRQTIQVETHELEPV